jgi:hypothetical protein
MGNFLRNYVTPLSLVTFAGTAVTGLMLFFGIRNHQLGEIHEWLGIGFVVIAILHLFRNGIGFATMMRRPGSRAVIGILGGACALVILAAGYGGYGFGGGPHGRGAGGPPQFRIVQQLAHAPIAQVAPALGLTPGLAIARLRKQGVAVTGPGQSIEEIAQKHGTSAPRLIALMLSGPDQEDG